MAKNLFGNLFSSDGLDKKYKKENDENVKRANAEKLDKEIESFNNVKQDIVWATRFDNFAKDNAALLEECQAYVENYALYKKLYDIAQEVIREDARLRQEHALKKAQELQRQKEEAARKRREYVLDFDNKIQKLADDKKRDKIWIKEVLQVNSDISTLSTDEKVLIKKGLLLKELLTETSCVSSAYSTMEAIMSLQGMARGKSFVEKYKEIRTILNNKKIAVYVAPEAIKLFSSLNRDYLEIEYEDIVNAARKLTSINTFSDATGKLMSEYSRLIEEANFDLNVVIPDFNKKWAATNTLYKAYLLKCAEDKVLNDAKKIYNKLNERRAQVGADILISGGNSEEQKKVDVEYAVVSRIYEDVKKSKSQGDLTKFEKAYDAFCKIASGIEANHVRLKKEAKMVEDRIEAYLEDIRKQFPLANYRNDEQMAINALLSGLKRELKETLAVSNGKLVYCKEQPGVLVDKTLALVRTVKTDKQLKAEEIEAARIEEENRRIAALKAKNNQIDQIFEMAQKGNPEAMYQLAVLYFNGDGVSKSLTEGIKWLEKSAKKGFPKAIEKMGDCYYNGYGVKQSFKEATKWYKKL